VIRFVDDVIQQLGVFRGELVLPSEKHLCVRSEKGQWGTQLVGGVGDELLLPQLSRPDRNQ
jgi:hypothetical protein